MLCYVMLCHTFQCMSNFIILFKDNITYYYIQNILEIIVITCYKFVLSMGRTQNLIQLCADLLLK
jgi:hypothetical protein